MSKCYKQLMRYLPIYWQDVKEMAVIQDCLGYEIGKLDCNMQEVFEQCFIETATWGLEIWEKEFALRSNLLLSTEQRREMLKAKLRGSSTTTKEMIANVAKAFSNGEVHVIEHNEQYYFEIKFVGTRGIPANMVGLKSILEEIKPAHLGINYVFTFATWGEVKKKTWGEIKKLTWDGVRHLPMN